MPTRPWYQTAILMAAAAAVGSLLLGSALDAVSNAFAFVTPRFTYVGTAVVVAMFGGAQLWLARRPLRWLVQGQIVHLTRLQTGSFVTVFGMIILLWVPRIFDRPDSSVRLASPPSQNQAPSIDTTNPQPLDEERDERSDFQSDETIAAATSDASATSPLDYDEARVEASFREQEELERPPTLLRLIQGDTNSTVTVASFQAAQGSSYSADGAFDFGKLAFSGWSPTGDQYVAMHILSECLRYDEATQAYVPDKRRLRGLYKRVTYEFTPAEDRKLYKKTIEMLGTAFDEGIDVLTRTASPIFDVVLKNTDAEPHVLHTITVDLLASCGPAEGGEEGSIPIGVVIPVAQEVTITAPNGCVAEFEGPRCWLERKPLKPCATRSYPVEPMIIPAHGVLRFKLLILMPDYEHGRYAFGLKFHLDERGLAQRVRFAIGVTGY